MRYATLRDAGAAEELAMNSQSTGWRCVLRRRDGRKKDQGPKEQTKEGGRKENQQEQIPRVKMGSQSGHSSFAGRTGKDVFSVSVPMRRCAAVDVL